MGGYNAAMRLLKTPAKRGFHVLHATRGAQAAMMTLAAGESTGEAAENEHPRAEQWVYVVAGAGTAQSGRSRVRLRPGSLLLIEKREPHRIANTGSEPLVTLNFYCPPAYTDDGDVRPSASAGNGPPPAHTVAQKLPHRVAPSRASLRAIIGQILMPWPR